MQELYSRHVGPDWGENLPDPKMWARIDSVFDAELWETHRTLKATLVNFARREAEAQRRRNSHSEELIEAAKTALDADTLTIGLLAACHLQAGQSAVHRYGALAAPPARSPSAGATHLRRQGASG